MATSYHVYVNKRTDLPPLKVGEPYIVEHPSMAIVEHPSRFLREHYVESGRRRSPHTWLAAAHHLVLWYDYLGVHGVDWRDAGREHLIGYRDALLGGISPLTQRR